MHHEFPRIYFNHSKPRLTSHNFLIVRLKIGKSKPTFIHFQPKIFALNRENIDR